MSVPAFQPVDEGVHALKKRGHCGLHEDELAIEFGKEHWGDLRQSVIPSHVKVINREPA